MPFLKKNILILIFFCISSLCIAQDEHAEMPADIKFIQNKGQWEKNVQYRASIPDGFLFIEKTGYTYLFFDGHAYDGMKHHFSAENIVDFHAIKVEFAGASQTSLLRPQKETTEYYNFFKGNDRSKWATGVRGYDNIKFENIYPGIDAEINSLESQLEYSFYLKPNADPRKIRIRYTGQKDMYIEDGNLRVISSISSFAELKPEAYCVLNGMKKKVECAFKLDGSVLSYVFPEGYDKQYPLVIDPVVVFSTFSGSVADNFGYTATYDDSGYAYSGGTVFDIGFPTTPGAFQRVFKGGVTGQPNSGDGRDIGILKYSPDGKRLIYCTYLGGTGNDDPHSLVVNRKYELVIFGNTCSNDFPIGQHFYDSTFNGGYDIYVAKFSTDGRQLLASTYVGGSDTDALNGYFDVASYLNQCTLGWNYGDVFRGEVNVDTLDNVYVATTTQSANFPITTGAFQPAFGGGKQDACIIKLAPDLDQLLKSSFLGGSSDDAGYGIAFDRNYDLYICGGTKSTNLSVQPGKYQTTFQGGEADGYIYKISKDFSTIMASTYLGTTSYDQTYFIQTDNNNNVYVTGQTKSNTFPIKNVKYSKIGGKQFIVKFKPTLDSIIYSTTFGSGRADPDLSPSAFLVDNCERVYFSGWGGAVNGYSHNKGSTYNLDTSPDGFQKTTDGSDFYLAVYAKDFKALLYGSYFGGPVSDEHVDGGTSRFDKAGIVYQSVCGGCGGLSDFPTTPGAWSRTNKGKRPGSTQGGCNNALFKLNLNIPDVFANFSVDTINCIASPTKIINSSQGGLTYYWKFGDGDTSTAFEPKHVYKDTGNYTITLIVRNIFSCTSVDSIKKEIVVSNHINSDFKYDTNVCVNKFIFTQISKYGNTFRWSFGDSNFSTLKNPEHSYKRDTGTYKVVLLVDSGTACENRITKYLKVKDFPVADFSYTIDTCRGKLVFTNLSSRSKSWLWDFGDTKSSNLKDPVHEYYSAGKFNIILYDEPGTVCADTASKFVEIKVPGANAVVDLDTCNFYAVLFNPSRYVFNKSIWYFGDGDSLLNVDSVIHKYPGSGSYKIKLIANEGTICVDTVFRTIVIPELPAAAFNFSRDNCSPFVLFKNRSAYSVRYEWQFSNGFSAKYSDSFTYRFDSSGKYTITLISYSAASCKDTVNDTVLIDHLALADFKFKMDTCKSDVKFTNLSTRTGSYSWSFGDNKLSNDISPDHVYDSAGTYEVMLIVKDDPCYDTIKKLLKIFDTEPISINSLNDSCSAKIHLSPSRNNAINYYWELGDGNTSSKLNLDYIYKLPGIYKIKLIVNRDTFCTDSFSMDVNITKYEIKDIVIPNIFTPNTDSKNEKFTVTGLNKKCDIYKLYIYNRWGQLIYESAPNDIEWDGKTGGKLVSPGTYYFILEGNGFGKTGTINVVY